MRKILLVVLVTIFIIISTVGCGDNSTSKGTVTQTHSPASTVSLNIENQKDKPTYFSCLSEVNNHLELNITAQEFLNNYNDLKSSYEDKNYKKLEMSDFFFIEKKH